MATFKQWLSQFEEEDSVFGDLADDVANDKGFPNSNDYEELRSHLMNSGACDEALKVLEEAYALYSRI